AVIGFIRLYLVLEGSPREARLLQDLVIGVVYIGMALSVLAFVFGVPMMYGRPSVRAMPEKTSASVF
ncbi:hypothetical protein ACCS78_41270, partial [Rhizobium johnstonii]